jgi:hypothetical protein
MQLKILLSLFSGAKLHYTAALTIEQMRKSFIQPAKKLKTNTDG